MSRVVLGVGASHSTLMNTHWHEVAGTPRAEAFKQGLADAAAAIAAAGPDVAVIIGSNHFRGMWLDLLPAFTLGVGEVVASGESGTPGGPQPADPELARHLLRSLVGGGFDVAMSTKLQIDHGQSHAIQWLLAGTGIPVVPLVVNVFAPPLPTLARCDALGAALGAAIATDGLDKRVVVIGSGGLSHRLPFPRWDDPHGEDEEFLVEAWSNGRGSWERYDGRRRQIIRAAAPQLSEDFDRRVLDLLEAGRMAELDALDDERVEAEGGNGAHEVRTWLAMAAATGHRPGRTLAYSPMPEWLTGMAVAVLDGPDERSLP